jgi:replicative DNA helicase
MSLPPHSLEAEQGILGCVLLDPARYDQAAEAGIDAGWFYDLRHADLFAAIGQMVQEGQRIDLITLGNRLKASDLLTQVGGLPYLSELMGAVPSESNLPYYIDIARSKMRLRKLLKAAHAIQERVMESDGDPETVIGEAETAILGIRSEFGSQSDATAKQIAREAIQDLQERVTGSIQKLPTGFGFLDRVLRGGMANGQMIVIAARPATGKTALAMTVARMVAGSGAHVGVISLEMTRRELGVRMMAQESAMDWGGFDQWNKPTEFQMRGAVAAVSRFSDLPITLYDGTNCSLGSISAKIRRWVAKGCKLAIIDYLQLMTGNPKFERREQVEEISRGVKNLARELQIPIIVLCQLNREVEKSGNRKPKSSDLRESGAIEQDADVIGLLYRPGKVDDLADKPDTAAIDVNLLIDKNRNGRGFVDIPFSFIPHLTLFEPKRDKPV